jgi:hypothetical protein
MEFKNGTEIILKEIQSDTEYTEEHLHHLVRWCGKKAIQGANDWYAPMDTSLSNFYRAISGNNTWGVDATDTAKLFGTTDLPISGMVHGDFDQILIVANSSSTVYICRLIWGTGTVGDAVSAGQYTEFPYLRGNSDNVRKIQTITSPLLGSYVAIWLQCMNATNDATIDFFIGVHGYNF